MRNSLGSLLQKRRSKEQEEEQRRQLLGEGRMRRQVRPLLLLLHVFLCLVALASDACEEVLLSTLHSFRQATSVAIDNLYQESNSLDRSNRAAQNIHEMGSSILSSLGQQNELIKVHTSAHCLGGGGGGDDEQYLTPLCFAFIQSAHRKLLDVGNTLGLSRSVMRMIENRQNLDKMLVYGGMLLTLLFLFALLYYFRW